MKRIMVAVDFSDISVFAVDVAAHVANSLKTKLRLVHVRTGKQYFPEFAKNNPSSPSRIMMCLTWNSL